METNIAQAFIEAIDYSHVKHIIRSNKSIKAHWGGITPSIADLKRVIKNMWARVSKHESAEDCVTCASACGGYGGNIYISLDT
jgi:hypothetical protein